MAGRPLRRNGVIQLPSEWLNLAVEAFNHMLAAGERRTIVQMPPIYGRTPPRLTLMVRNVEADTLAAFVPERLIVFLNKEVDRLFSRPYPSWAAGDDRGDKRSLTPAGRQVLAHELRHFIQYVLSNGGVTMERGGPRRKARGSLIERARPAYMGAVTRPLDEDERVSVGVRAGLLVTEVGPTTPAEQAGVRAGDILVAYDGMPLYKHSDLVGMVAKARPGDQVQLFVIRGGRVQPLRVVLQARPEDPEVAYLLSDVEYQAWLGDAVDKASARVASGSTTVRDEIAAFQDTFLAMTWKAFAPRKYRDALSTLYNELTRR